MTKKIISIFVAVMMVLSIIPAAAFASDGNRRAERPNTAVSVVPAESSRDAADLNEALNVPGGELVFVSEGTYPWVVDGDAAKSSNAGVSSSTSAVSTTATAVEGDIVQFDFKAWGEGTNTYWDKCEFAIDGTVVLSKGAYANEEWEAFSTELTPGSHTLTWSYTKDSSVNPTGDYFAVDNVYVGQPVVAESINVDPVSVPAGRTARVSYEVLPAAAYDKSVTFATADASIATVNAAGVVTGVAEGTTTITVTSAAVPTVSGTATVTVTEALPAVNLEGFATYDLASSGLAGNWIGFADYDPSVATVLGAMEGDAWAGAFAGGSVYGYIYSDSGSGHNFYIMDPETYSVSFPGTNADAVGGVIGMAYNHANQTMYGIGVGNNEIVTVDLATGVPSVVAAISNTNIINVLAIDLEGNAYTMTSGGNLMALDLTNGSTTLIGSTGVNANYVQSMTYDFTTDMIYWAQIYSTSSHGLYVVDPETASAELLGAIGPGGAEVTSLYIKNDLPIDDIEMPDVTVTFVDGLDSTVLGTQTVEAGTVLDESTFPTAPEHAGFEFTGWDYDGAAVYADTTIMAMYHDPNATIWDFETDPVEQGFTFLDQDGDNFNWYWHVNTGSGNLTTHSGDGVAASESYDNDTSMALTPDNWMVTPEFNGSFISFWMQAQDPSYSDDYVGVYVSTDGGETWSDELFGQMTPTAYQQFTIDLSAYAGQNINVAFRHYNSYDMFIALIDDIEVSGGGSEPTDPIVIDTVEIIGLDEPVLGGYPDMDVSVPDGAPYTLTKVEWHNMGKGIIGEDFEFVPGIYYLVVEFVPEEGYVFGAVSDTTMLVNGSSELVGLPIFCYSFPELFHMETTEFTVEEEDDEPVLIDAIEILDFVEPAWGENPFFDVTVPDDANYTIVDAEWEWWSDDDFGDMTETDVFDSEEFEYTMRLVVIPDEGYEFSEDVVITINGEQALVDANFVYNNYDEVIFYTIGFYVEEPPALPTLDEALNIEGGELHFESEGAYPWIVVTDTENDRIFAMSSNGGVASSDSIVTTTFTANAGDVVKFEYKAFGEGTSTYWDYCEFLIDGVRAGYWGAQQNDWELFTSEPLTAGEHTLTWKYHKDSSVNPNGDFFAVDNVEIAEGELPATGILGDTDMNGEVTTADALLALRYIMGLVDFTDEQIEQAEVTGEGDVTIADSLLILRKAMGLIELFPAEIED